MKIVYYVVVGLLFFSSQQVVAQELLDTVYVGSKKKEIAALTAFRYYYYPNLQTYFDTERDIFISKEKGVLIASKTIDVNARGYSVRNGAYEKIEDYLGDEPFSLYDEHRLEYPADYSSKRKPRSSKSKK